MADGDGALTIVVDGREVTAEPGQLLIAAAERAGTYIPRFCWHPRMKPVGMCRMCLVEVEGPRGKALQPACMLPVADGMKVDTTSAAVKKAQDGVLEFLLINHPLDCPVCDRGGECPLQDQTFAYGPGESRFVEEKRHFEKPIAISDLVLLDRERCIQCSRCTRFAEEVAGDPLIQFVDRGNQLQVLTFPDEPFASYFSGNTVQICPVGALLASPYRFRARPWDLEQSESTCTSCAVGCRVLVQSSSDRLVRYLGIDSEPVNHGWLCDKGRFDFEAAAHEARLGAPRIRRDDDLVETSWAEALQAAADGLRAAGPSVAVIGGSRLTNEAAYAWAKLAKGLLGTDDVDAQLGDGLPAEAILGLPRATIDDACRAKALVLLCGDLKDELPVLYLRVRAAALERDVPLIELTPQATALTPLARVSLAYRPGEAAAVAAALARDGERGAGGVSGDAIDAARAVLREAGDDVVVVLGRPSLAESGETVARAAAALAEALPAATFLPALRRANVHGALDMGLAPGILPGRLTLDEGRDWFGSAWGDVPDRRGLDTTGILAAAADGRVQALVLLGADPVRDFPDRQLAERALAATPFVIAVDTFLNDSSRRAHVVLAASGYGETAGTTTNLEGRVSRVSQKVTPPGTARADWMIASELAFRLGDDLGFESLADVWTEIERLAPSHAGLTAELLTRHDVRDGVVVPLHGEPEPATGVLPEEADAAGKGSQFTGDPRSVQEAPVTAPPGALPSTGAPGVESTSELAAHAPGPEPVEAGPPGADDVTPAEPEVAPEQAAADESAATQAAAEESSAVEQGETSGGGRERGDGDTGKGRPAALRFSPPRTAVSLPPVDAYSLRLVVGRALYDAGMLQILRA